MSLKHPFVYQIAIVFLGIVIASFLDLSDITHSPLYTYFTYLLLAIGLYGSVVAIDGEEVKNHRRIILTAVTVGVFLKASIIGTIVWLFIQDKLAYLLGIAVAQIDPLSVAALLQEKTHPLSERARTILAAWSSFDDPMTVIMSLYVLSLLDRGTTSIHSLELFVYDFALNLLFALLFYILYLPVKRNNGLQYLLLGLSLLSAAYLHFMLGMAIVGLFLRPPLRILPQVVNLALYAALLLLGFILINGISLGTGFLIALGAVTAQIIVGFLVTRGLDFKDRLHLAFAQQNGITAIILSLLFEASHSGVVAIVAPAILFINLSYYATNAIINRFTQ